MVTLNIKSAWRSILRHRMVMTINLIGLSVGMTAAVLIFLWVRNELSYDAYHTDADRIYRITTHLSADKTQIWEWETIPANLSDLAQKELPGIQSIGMLMTSDWAAPTIGVGTSLFKEKNTALVDKGWFDLFHYDIVNGSVQSFLDDPHGLVVTQSIAEKYFGHKEAIGQIIRIDSVAYMVKAVTKDNPTNSSFSFSILRNRAARLLDSNSRKNDMEWGEFNYITFIKMGPNSALGHFTTALTRIYKQARNLDSSNHTYFSLEPLRDMHFETGLQNSSLRHGDRKLVYIFSVLGFVLLGIACINYVNLTTARAGARAREVGVRKVLGAMKKELFVQFLLESAMVSGLALVLTLLVVKLALPFFNDLTQNSFQFSLSSMSLWEVIGGTLALAIALNSIYPALLLSSFQPMKVLRRTNVLEVKDGTLRKSLVVVQFAVTLVLLVGTIVIDSQMKYIRTHSPGFEEANLFDCELPTTIYGQYNYDFKKLASLGLTLRTELMRQPGIKTVSIASGVAIDIKNMTSGSVDYDGRDKDFIPSVTPLTTDSGFLRLFNLEMKSGRWLNGYQQTDNHHYILNETAVSEWHIHTPVIGQRFAIHGDTGIIVGVVKDFHFKNFHDLVTPMVAYATDGSGSDFIIQAEPGQAKAALEATHRVWDQFFPGSPFDYVFLKDSFDKIYRSDLSASALFLIFSWIAVLISALGLFGLAAFMAARRTKEIGIRKILGASARQLVTLLSKDFVRLVIVAVIVGLPIAWWASKKWLEGFVYRVDLTWWMFGLAAAVCIGIAVMTVSLHAIRTASEDPVKNLRTE